MEDNKPIEIDLRKYNKISFDLTLEGTNKEDLNECKFIIEDKEISFMFDASFDETSNTFNILIPPLKTNLRESVLYKSKLQVMIDGQVFEPLETFVKGKESPKIKIGNFQNESVSSEQTGKPAVKVTTVKPVTKEKTKQQLLEHLLKLKEEIQNLDIDSEEYEEKKEELVQRLSEYKSMK